MKKLILLLFICLFSKSLTMAQNNDLIRISTSIEMEPYTTGYVNSAGDTVIAIGKYSYCFSEEFHKIAIVGIKGQSGFYAIDRNERILFRVHGCDNGPDYVKDGLFRIIMNDKKGYANMNGEIVIPPKFDFAFPFKNGFAVVCFGGTTEPDGEHQRIIGAKWAIININGDLIIDPIYDGARSANENGEAKVKKNGEWMTIQLKD